jgi:hypothetical protein
VGQRRSEEMTMKLDPGDMVSIVLGTAVLVMIVLLVIVVTSGW